MAMLMKPSAYQHPALATQLTPPPSPGRVTVTTTIKYTANTGKLRRERTPEPLNLKQSNYEPYFKNQAYAKIIAENVVKKNDSPVIPKRKTFNATSGGGGGGGVSPLSVDFEVTGATEVSRPASYFPIEQQSPAFPATPRSKFSIATPTIHEARFARQLPVSAFSSQTPKTIALDRKDSTRPELPKLVTVTRKPVQRSTSLRHNTVFPKQEDQTSKELPLPPPPPRKENSPQRTIVPSIDPDVFPMPETDKHSKKSNRILRSVQSIGLLQSVPKPSDPTRWDSRPSTARSNKGLHKRFFSGGVFGSTSPTKSMGSSFSSDHPPQARMVRRLSQLSRRRGSTALEDPLAPVSIIPVMSNDEDVAGGLTYLPRYTNNFAGFCKSAWRLQLADAKSFEIKNRNSKTQSPMLKCSKCTFEGPLYPQHIVGDRYVWAKVPDSRIYSSFGVSYTWQFLFKSHLTMKKENKTAKPSEGTQYSHPLAPPVPKHNAAEVDMADGLFGCILCCAKGVGVPVFRGPESLSWHLRSHANDTIKDQEVTHRFKIIIGREPEPNERFDVHIPQLSGSESNGASVSVALYGDGQWEEPGKTSSEFGYSPYQPASRTMGPTSVSTPMLDLSRDSHWGNYPPLPNTDAITSI